MTTPLYRLTRDQLCDIIEDPGTDPAVRAEARLEFDAATDAIEGR